MNNEIQKISISTVKESVHEQLDMLLKSSDAAAMKQLLDLLSFSEGLREVLHFSAENRDRIFQMLPPETAADLIREAPDEVAVELIERLDLNSQPISLRSSIPMSKLTLSAKWMMMMRKQFS